MRTPDENVKGLLRNLPQGFIDWLTAERDDMRGDAEKPMLPGAEATRSHTNGQTYVLTCVLKEIEDARNPT